MCAIIEYILIIHNHCVAFSLIELNNIPINFSFHTIKENSKYIFSSVYQTYLIMFKKFSLIQFLFINMNLLHVEKSDAVYKT